MVRSPLMNGTRMMAGLAAGAALSTVSLLLAQEPPKAPRRDVAKVFGELCANCHGPTLEGAQFGSLVDDQWKFGSDDASLAKSIREGHPVEGMPAMAGALTEQEIR